VGSESFSCNTYKFKTVKVEDKLMFSPCGKHL
jgi:hypothetical protein